jgi:hypothetical protein
VRHIAALKSITCHLAALKNIRTADRRCKTSYITSSRGRAATRHVAMVPTKADIHFDGAPRGSFTSFATRSTALQERLQSRRRCSLCRQGESPEAELSCARGARVTLISVRAEKRAPEEPLDEVHALKYRNVTYRLHYVTYRLYSHATRSSGSLAGIPGMKSETEDQTDRLIKSERRGIWVALMVVLALTAAFAFAGETRRVLMAEVVPFGIIFGAIWINRGKRAGAGKTTSKHRELVSHDELRLSAISRSYKWAFLLMLGELSAFCVVSAATGSDLPGQMVALLAVVAGAIGFLACFLLFDRA